jgi:hypothetical protein
MLYPFIRGHLSITINRDRYLLRMRSSALNSSFFNADFRGYPQIFADDSNGKDNLPPLESGS